MEKQTFNIQVGYSYVGLFHLSITSVLFCDFSSFQVKQRQLLLLHLLHWQLLQWHQLRKCYLEIAHGWSQVLKVSWILAQACLLGMCTCIFRIWRVHICQGHCVGGVAILVVQFAFIVEVLAGIQLHLVEQSGLTAAKGQSQLLPMSHKSRKVLNIMNLYQKGVMIGRRLVWYKEHD